MRPYPVLAAVLCLLVAACGSSGTETADPPPPAVPAATPLPTPTTAPTPEPTPLAVERICPEGRDNAGLRYEYDPGQMLLLDAVDEFCGTAAPLELVCYPGLDNAGLTFEWDPDEESAPEARARHCGTLAPVGRTCPDGTENAGLEYTWDADEESVSESRERNCGSQAPPSAWTVFEHEDVVTGRKSISAFAAAVSHTGGYQSAIPELWVSCHGGDDLVFTVYFGGYLLFGALPDGKAVEVAYRFDDGPPVERKTWYVGEFHEWAGAPVANMADLASRTALHQKLAIRFIGRLDEVTVVFDLAGAETDVGAVLEACGR